ncbi:MAG: MBL fold metallo-hydrolase [Nitrososphaerales archaeon]|nr:MBL fold metallo-hydrolase [Nitrososphaerales archaeon]
MLDTMALGQPKTVSAFLVKGPKVTLVDCGYASSYETVLAGLREVGVAPSDVRYVIPTHVHLDHSGAAGRLLKLMPNAEVIAHEKGTPHLVDPTRLIESATRVFGKAIMDLYGPPEPIPAGRVTSVGKESHLDLGDGMSATLLHSPGHAPHQLSVMLDGARTLLTADAVGIVYPGTKAMIPTTPPPSFDPTSLINSVNLLGQTDPNLLLLPHFGARRDVRSILENTRGRVTEWVKAVAAMRKEKKDLDEITDVMVARVTSEEGIDDLPIYARVSVRTSVMGILNYLDKNT